MRLHQTDEHNYVEFQPAGWLVKAKNVVATGMLGLLIVGADVAVASRIIDVAKNHDLASIGAPILVGAGLIGLAELGVGIAFIKAAYSK